LLFNANSANFKAISWRSKFDEKVNIPNTKKPRKFNQNQKKTT